MTGRGYTEYARTIVQIRTLVLSPLVFSVGCLGVLGCKGDDPRASTAAAVASASAAGVRAVAISVDGKGFTPSSVDTRKGEKLQLVFTRTTDDTCAKEVVFPEISVKKDLPLNRAVAIDVPTDAPRTLTFQCGMAMYKSKVVIN
jgi:plastocyanin domain-containing protein